MNYFGSFNYGDLVGEEQLKQLRKRTREHNAYQKRIMRNHGVEWNIQKDRCEISET